MCGWLGTPSQAAHVWIECGNVFKERQEERKHVAMKKTLRVAPFCNTQKVRYRSQVYCAAELLLVSLLVVLKNVEDLMCRHSDNVRVMLLLHKV